MSKRKFKKLPQGFGSVVYLGEGRRKPYAARLSASGKSTGQNTPKAIGYFETWQKAYDALSEYNRLHGGSSEDPMTFADVYALLVERKEKRPQGMSHSLQSSFRQCFNRSEPLHKRIFAEIKTRDYQALLDSQCGTVGTSILSHVRGLWIQMGRLAEELDICQKNYASFCVLNQADDTEHSEIFTEDEIRILWENSVDPVAAMLLVMIYSGFRISEYESIDTDLIEWLFRGGMKTKAGKNRIVPIHSRIRPLVTRIMESGGYMPETQPMFRRKIRPCLERIGIDPKKHTPHDCRATFASRLYAAGVPDLYIKRMIGHSAGDLTKDVYTEVMIETLRENLERMK